MITKSREEIIEALKIIRKCVCSYGTGYGKRCDCKFGVTKEKFGKGHEDGCGCPELYQAIELLKFDTKELDRLTDKIAKEYAHYKQMLDEIQTLAKKEIEAGSKNLVIRAIESMSRMALIRFIGKDK
jgi:hypothetical protein